VYVAGLKVIRGLSEALGFLAIMLGSPIKLVCSLLIQFGGFDAIFKVKYDVMKEIEL
jgi:hypothetical protein